MINNMNMYYTSDAPYKNVAKIMSPAKTTTTTTTKSSVPAATPTQTAQTQPVYYGGGGGGGEEESVEEGIDKYARIADAYERMKELLQGNYNSQVGVLNAAKKKSTKETKQDAEKALRQAYVSNMLGRRDLNQRLALQGLNGGATETTLAKLANQYGNARTDIVNQRARDISGINQTYAENLAKALQDYNSALANLEMSRLQMELSLD